MTLCTICKLMCEDRKWENYGPIPSGMENPVVVLYDHRKNSEKRIMHDSWETFLVSLSQNCPICWSMWRKIRSSPLADAREETRYNFQTILLSINYNLDNSGYRTQLHIQKNGESLGLPILNIWKTTEQCFLGTCFLTTSLSTNCSVGCSSPNNRDLQHDSEFTYP